MSDSSSPTYCTLSQGRLAEIHARAPTVKFIFVMRDPVDRLWSAVRMRARQVEGDFENICRSLSKEIIANERHPMLSRSRYNETVRNLCAAVGEQDRLFLFYETMFADETRHQICDFLGIQRHKGSDKKRVNAGRPADLPEDILSGFHRLLKPQYDAIHAAFGTLVPQSWLHPS